MATLFDPLNLKENEAREDTKPQARYVEIPERVAEIKSRYHLSEMYSLHQIIDDIVYLTSYAEKLEKEVWRKLNKHQ